MTHRLSLPVVLFLVLIVFGTRGFADTFEWIDPNAGNFLDAANWRNISGVDHAPPNAGDTALFNETGTYTVTLTADAALDLLDVDAGTITFDSSGGPHTYIIKTGAADTFIDGSDITLDGSNLSIGDVFSVVNSTMRMQGGSDISVGGTTSIATSTGDAVVAFNASSFDFGGLVRMGLSGFDATLTLVNGSVGNIDGDLDFARSGTLGSGGFLNVNSGSILTTGGRVLLGDIISNGTPSYNTFITVDNGTFTMNGANILRVGDSLFDNVNAELKVRNNGTFTTGTGSTIVQRTGLLTIESGGTFNAEGTLAINQGATLTLDGGSLNANAGLDVSDGVLDFRDGTLTVTGGEFLPNAGGPTDDYSIDGPSAAEMPHLVLGAGATANIGKSLRVGFSNQGQLTVTGSGSQSNNVGGLYVGYSGTGILNVADGGVVSSTSGTIGRNTGSTGTATVSGNGSEWKNNQNGLSVGSSGTGTLNVVAGGVVSNAHGRLGGFAGSTGTATVSGSGSQWNTSSDLYVGFSGTGTLNVEDGGVVSDSRGYIGTLSGSTGTVTVTGSGSEWNNSGSLYVGGKSDVAGGTGSLTITNDGSVDVAGTLKIWDQGTVTLDGGSLNANAGLDASDGVLDFRDGTLTVTGGEFLPNAGGPTDDYSIDGPSAAEMPHLVLGAGATANIGNDLRVGSSNQGQLTVTDGGVVSNSSGFLGRFTSSTGTARVTGSGSQWSNSGALEVGYLGTGTLYVTGGGVVSNSFGRIGASTDTTGTATVTGDGSQWNNSGVLYVGESGTGTLNVADGGVVSSTSGLISHFAGSTGTVTVTGSGSEWNNSSYLSVGHAGTATLNVADGGVVSNTDSYVGLGLGSTGTATVTGIGSEWNNFGSLYVGGNSISAGGTGNLTIADDGLVDVDDALKIWDQGTVTLDGGHIVVNTLDNTQGGTLNWLAGSLTINSGVEVGSGTAFPFNLTLNTHRTLITPATTTIAANRTLVLDGGQLTTNDLNVDGALQFNRGTLEFTGGTVTGLTQLNVPTGGALRATGVLGLPVSAASGSQIVATGDLTLGDAASTGGFYSNGNVDLGDNTLTVSDLNDAVFDSGAVVSLGSSGAGTLLAANGLTLDFGGNIIGFGTIDTPDSAATPFVNNGHIAGNSGAEPITLTGHVKGVGTLDNVVITGTDAPGFSPATVYRGSVEYAGSLEIEIGGNGAGDFDQINHILGAGIADLGGTLDVRLMGGFSPTAGDTFEIIIALSLLDTFDGEVLPALGGGLAWFVDYQPTSVLLSVGLAGDFNLDGMVDGLDFLAWQRNPGIGNLADWEANYGSPVTASSTAVPEPSALIMALAALAMAANRRRS